MIICFMSIILLSLGKSTLLWDVFQKTNKQKETKHIRFLKGIWNFSKGSYRNLAVISLEGRASDIRLQEIKGRNGMYSSLFSQQREASSGSVLFIVDLNDLGNEEQADSLLVILSYSG